MYDFNNWKISIISLGSNIGDREKFIGSAVQEIACIDGVEILSSSSLMNTDPVGVDNQETYLNQLLLINTNLSPQKLLKTFKDLEVKLGRCKRGFWGPREIDIDIVIYEGMLQNTPDLVIPHPQFFNRKFLMMGAIELFPEYIVDGTDMSVEEIYNEIKDTLESQNVEICS